MYAHLAVIIQIVPTYMVTLIVFLVYASNVFNNWSVNKRPQFAQITLAVLVFQIPNVADFHNSPFASMDLVNSAYKIQNANKFQALLSVSKESVMNVEIIMIVCLTLSLLIHSAILILLVNRALLFHLDVPIVTNLGIVARPIVLHGFQYVIQY